MKVTIPYKPHQYQLKFHRDTTRFRIAIGGRRVGKTLCCLQEVIRHCVSVENALVYWIAPTYHIAKEIGFDEFLKFIDVLKPAIFSINHTRLKVVFTNGSQLYFKGSDNPDALRGRGLTLAVLDEAAFTKSEVWSKIIRPALSDRKGYAILVSTPNGYNWFKELYDKGKGWSKYLWPTSLNPLIPESELLAVQEEISRDEYRQEYLAEFVTRAGRVYDEFTGANIIESVSPDTNSCDIYLGMDFGFAHHTAIAFMAVYRATENHVIQFDELYIQKHQMEDIVKMIRTKLAEHGLEQSDIEVCYTDPAGNADELSSGLSPVDILRNEGFKIINKGSTINAGIALVRSFLKNSLGKIRYTVTENCKETIRSFNGYQYSSNKDGLVKEEALKDNLHDHMMDAIRYFFVNKFDHAKYVATMPDQSSYANSGTTKTPKRCSQCRNIFISTTPKNRPPFVCQTCLEG